MAAAILSQQKPKSEVKGGRFDSCTNIVRCVDDFNDTQRSTMFFMCDNPPDCCSAHIAGPVATKSGRDFSDYRVAALLGNPQVLPFSCAKAKEETIKKVSQETDCLVLQQPTCFSVNPNLSTRESQSMVIPFNWSRRFASVIDGMRAQGDWSGA